MAPPASTCSAPAAVAQEDRGTHGGARMLRRLVILLAAVAVLATGCARRVPVEELDAAGARVGATVVMKDGQALRCRVLSLSRQRMVVDAYYTIGGETDLRGVGGDQYVYVGGERVDGDVMSVERSDGERTAVVRRSLSPSDVDAVTFHRSGSEASLGPVLSALVGPLVGALLALLI